MITLKNIILIFIPIGFIVYVIYAVYKIFVIDKKQLLKKFDNIIIGKTQYCESAYNNSIDYIYNIYDVIDKYKDEHNNCFIKLKDIYTDSKEWCNLGRYNHYELQQVKYFTLGDFKNIILPNKNETVLIEQDKKLLKAKLCVNENNKFYLEVYDFDNEPCTKHYNIIDIEGYYKFI